MSGSTKSRVGEIRQRRVADAFFEMQADPFSWQRKANELCRAALLLGKQFEADARDVPGIVRNHLSGISDPPNLPCVLSQFMLLAAFCLENLFKGLILLEEPQLIEKGQITGILKSHDLLALASRANMQLATDEKRLCELARSASVSWGRYPISRTAGEALEYSRITSESFAVFEQLAMRASALINERYPTRMMRVQTPSGEKFMRGVISGDSNDSENG